MTIGFFVTNRCNFNCAHCILKTLNGGQTLARDLPVVVFERSLNEGRELGFNHVSLTGGEPILHPQFAELIKLVKKYHYTYGFASNAWFYRDYWKAIGQSRENLNYITFSLDGDNAEVHDSIRGAAGSFDRVIEAVDFYRKQQVNIGVNFLLSQKNYRQIAGTTRLCAKLGVEGIFYTGEIPSGDSGLPENEKREALAEIGRLQKEFGNCLNIRIGRTLADLNFQPDINACPAFNGQRMVIDFDGGMFFCCNLYQPCKNKPLVQNVGFKEAYRINLEAINEFKRRHFNFTCDSCNQHIENCLKHEHTS